MTYTPHPARYQEMTYQRCGNSGLLLPAISLGLWHNFGSVDNFDNGRAIIRHAFDSGITHFDLANNYGPVPGSAEENFGRILKKDFGGHLRDEIVISTKAGYTMWPGPYGDHGSRKYLISSLDQSLQRMQLDYVDIFYSHRPDPETPIAETMGALHSMVQQGKALYVGLSNYTAAQTAVAVKVLRELGTPCLIHQPKYSMFVRWVEEGLLDVLQANGVGCIPFSPLAQGVLTNKYLQGIPDGSRASKGGFLKAQDITPEKLEKITRLNDLAVKRGQTLAQMALAWVLKDPRVTTVLIGASSTAQLDDNLVALRNREFSHEELEGIEAILK
ncbi:L-glyceraldehyde 3-phosphate reductase [Chitinophaga sp. sic0106]|uniref:L-glyceraldehyde 3-phosphate reductase n=1 Tax=Chitinophaga sp. sic0106 TaxID=2854785 RepID=UPI001C4652F0|nr:L-glyceraldehyde 3-phosphate reductase [Chitinophaga sp. sic0106]MBV7532435.1 L-glyceraldehyde 3-phosphate reductase [Chitinophaga sp. sic0106]